MTEYELIDVVATFNSNSQSWVATYFAGITAYLVAAYAVGNKLTRSQVVIVNACFIAFSALCGWAVVGALSRALDFATELLMISPEREFAINPAVVWVAAGIMIAGVFIGPKFMWDIRRFNAG